MTTIYDSDAATLDAEFWAQAEALNACAHTPRSNHRQEIHADVQAASPSAN
jgi:hypothetical protein